MGRFTRSLHHWIGIAAVGALLTPALATPPSTGSPSGASRDGALSSVSQLRQLGRALLMYAQDYDERLPPMNDVATVKKRLLPYVRRNESLFVQPQTHEPYQPNPSLSGRRRASITLTGGLDRRGNPIRPRHYRANLPGLASELVAFYEASPAPDGTRAVLFLDGHVQVIPESEWPRLKRASKIP